MAWRNIVVTQHCKVSMKMNLLVVQTDDDTVQIPIDDIGMVLFATTQAVITTSAMASLLERDIKVVFCNDKHLPIGEVVPEKLRTLDHGRPWSDDQFASTRLSSSRDMSR